MNIESLTEILKNCNNPDNTIRKQAENQIMSMTIDSELMQIFFSYLLDENCHISFRKMLTTIIKNYINDYFVSFIIIIIKFLFSIER